MKGRGDQGKKGSNKGGLSKERIKGRGNQKKG